MANYKRFLGWHDGAAPWNPRPQKNLPQPPRRDDSPRWRCEGCGTHFSSASNPPPLFAAPRCPDCKEEAS